MKYLKIVSVFLLILLISGCDIKNPAEGLEVRIKNISRNTYITVDFYNAATGAIISEDVVTVDFIGDNKDKVRSSSNEEVTSVKSSEGNTIFYLADNVNPTPENPVRLRLECKAEGYIEETITIDVVRDGLSQYTAVLYEKDNLPENVFHEELEITITNPEQGLPEDVNYSVGDTNTSSWCKVDIPKGSKFVDAEGNAVANPTITVTLYGGNQIAINTGNPIVGRYSRLQKINTEIIPDVTPIVHIGMGNSLPHFSNTNLTITVGCEPLLLNVPEPQFLTFLGQGNQLSSPQNLPSPQFGDEDGDGEDDHFNYDVPGQQDFANAFGGYLQPDLDYSIDVFILIDNEDDPNVCTDIPTKITFETINDFNSDLFFELDCDVEYMSYVRGLTVSGRKVVRANEPFVELDYGLNFPVRVIVYKWQGDFSNKSELMGFEDFTTLCNNDHMVGYDNPTVVNEIYLSTNVICDSHKDNPRIVKIDGIPVFCREVDANGNPLQSHWVNAGVFDEGNITNVCLEPNKYYEVRIEFDGEMYYSKDYTEPFYIGPETTEIHYEISDDNRICSKF